MPKELRRFRSVFRERSKQERILLICLGIGLSWCLLLNFVIHSQFLSSFDTKSSSFFLSTNPKTYIDDTFPAKVAEETWEEIEHPASVYQRWLTHNEINSTKRFLLSVPYMYKVNMTGTMTLDQANAIGSHIYLHALNRGIYKTQLSQKEPEQTLKSDTTKVPYIKLETINVMIASFRDGPMCKNTINGIFTRAKYPERVRVTVVDQVLKNSSSYYSLPEDQPCTIPDVSCSQNQTQTLCKWRHHIDTLPFDAMESSGPCTSRHLSYRMYRGEYFVLQTDSHVEFTNQWDEDIIEQWRSTDNEMAVLSVYPDDVKYVKDGVRKNHARAIMCDTKFEQDEEVGIHLRHDQQPSLKPDFPDQQLQLEPFWGAGFSFSRGHFPIQVPYDLYLPHIFQGEETNIGVRGFTYGYDFYAPSRPIVYHYYHPPTDLKKKKKKKRLKFWDLPTYSEDVARSAMQRLNAIINLKESIPMENQEWFFVDSSTYGVGSVRTTDEYYRLFGIHRHNQSVEDNLCMFVASKEMNIRFLPALRSDTMGLDYNHSNLKDFSFHNSWPCSDYWWLNDEKECAK